MPGQISRFSFRRSGASVGVPAHRPKHRPRGLYKLRHAKPLDAPGTERYNLLRVLRLGRCCQGALERALAFCRELHRRQCANTAREVDKTDVRVIIENVIYFIT